MTYTGLLFSYQKTQKELELAERYFSRYIAKGSQGVIDAWRQQLMAFRQGARRDSRCSWTIPQARPLKTIESFGAYQPDDHGLRVYGELSAIWEIEHVGQHRLVGRKDEVFRLYGVASTLAKIIRVADDGSVACVAAWHFDVGVTNSPGYHFHTQVPTWPDSPNRAAETYFPPSVDVPRFPALLFFPLDAFEFLLNELFHAAWPPYAASQHGLIGYFDYQMGRLGNLLTGWGLGTGGAMPLSFLRSYKPKEEIFLL